MFPFNSINNTPSYVWYADKPPLLGGTPRKMPIAEFMAEYERKGGKPFEYSEAIWVDPQKVTLKESYNPYQQEILDVLSNPRPDNFAICFIDEEVGFGVFARTDIPAFKIISLYTGDTLDWQKCAHLNPYDKTYMAMSQGTTVINAKDRGGIARFFQHLPSDSGEIIRYTADKGLSLKEDIAARERLLWLFNVDTGGPIITGAIRNSDPTILNQLLFDLLGIGAFLNNSPLLPLDNKCNEYIKALRSNTPELGNYLAALAENFLPIENTAFFTHRWLELKNPELKIATANTLKKAIEINGVSILSIFTLREIKCHEQIGFDYNSGYWTNLKKLPKIFTTAGAKVKENDFCYKQIAFSDWYAKHAKEYFLKINDYTPIQTQPFEQPISIFAFRDKLSENNLISSEHRALNLSDYPAVKKLADEANKKKIIVKYYHCNPDNMENKSAKKMNLVLFFPDENTDKTTFKRCIKRSQEYILLKKRLKYFDVTQEIIFEYTQAETNAICELLMQVITGTYSVIPEIPYDFMYRHYSNSKPIAQNAPKKPKKTIYLYTESGYITKQIDHPIQNRQAKDTLLLTPRVLYN